MGAQSLPIRNQFDHLSVKDGLSNNSVLCILQDREGFMWFGTDDGLNKYDGYTFRVFKPDPADRGSSFQNNQIYGLCEDHRNRLWVATLGGLHEIDKRTGRVTPHLIQTADAHRWNYQHSVCEDSQHQLWISTLGGVARYEPRQHRFRLYPLPRPEATIKTVFEDPQHRFWVGTYEGLYLLNPATGHYTLVPVSVPAGAVQPTFIAFQIDARQTLWMATATTGHGLFRLDLNRQPFRPEPYNPQGKINPFTFLNSLRSDQQGIFWLATTTGLQRIDPARHQVFTYQPDPNAPNGISSNTAQTVYIDRAGTLWVGTDNGVDRQSVSLKSFQTYQIQPTVGTANLTQNKVIALAPDQAGRCWVSTGYDVYRPASDGQPRRVLPVVLGSTNRFRNYIRALLPDSASGIWLGTTTGLYRFNPASGRYTFYPSDVPIEYISRATSGELWVGGYVVPTSGIASFNPQTHRYCYYKYQPGNAAGLPDQFIHGLLASRTGNEVWIPFRKQGVGCLNRHTGRFCQYRAGPHTGLSSNDIQTIYEDDAGIIWVGTNQGGLNRFDPQQKRFRAITTQQGLPSNNITAISSDRAGNLWISTDNGLCRFDPIANVFRNYYATDGLPSNSFMRNAVYRQNDRLYFGSLNGVVHFNPDSIRDDNRPFPVHITALSVMNRPRPLTDSLITLQHDENFLSFGFTALNYAQPEQNRFAYQLVGIDKNWVDNGNRHFANYTNLSPGRYTFRVKAANGDGFWNEKGASVALLIRPPWWATWWAYSLYALLAMGAIWASVRVYANRIRQQQAVELSRQEAGQLKTVDELKTRFFTNMTHEFRTPLSLILSPVEKLLRDNQIDSVTRQSLGLVQRNAERLLQLVNQLLDLSKLESNQMTGSLVRGEPGSFVSRLVESFCQFAEQKGVRLDWVVNMPSHEYLFDADKWEKIVTNLLSNAVKFTDADGQITVTLQADTGSDTALATAVTISVTDTGIGIAPENLPHIFDRFYQVDTSHTRAYEGTGIGLALVNELVRWLRGIIEVRSQPGRGSTFAVTLPVLPVSANYNAPRLQLTGSEPIPMNYSSATNESIRVEPIQDEQIPLVLLVDDNDDLRTFLASELSATYRVLQAADGEQGWHLTQTELPDIVVSDVMMPRLDGYELTHRIKNNPYTDHIAVVILSARTAHSSRLEGLQEGADDYLAKPFHVAELHLRLRNLTQRQQRLRDQYRQLLAQSDTPSPLNRVEDLFLQRVYQLLESHLSNPALTVDWLADELAMSRKTLYRKIHSLTQLNPHELIRQYRLRKAADLLRAGHTASQTAYLTGFKTPSYFTMVFKEFYRKTPTEFVADSPRRV
ncbi:hybrid sensor histidine kinase/response regulator [Spirosoma montaniterrae]|uniref:histidine kinase n=2 Tax=Spirosoma montaniterrae TaxID=1178516 RepID=A0A1P9WT30_9BACT|nr:hybrid sensor histidine kinase/response regulator [Spirosoma montaniterrae]